MNALKGIAIGMSAMLFSAVPVFAQYTFQTITVPNPFVPTQTMRLIDIIDNGDMLVQATDFAARVAVGTTTAVPAICPTNEFFLRPESGMIGPALVAMNNAGTAVGGAAASDADYAIISTKDGHCNPFIIGAGTFAQSISDNNTIYGMYWLAPFGAIDGLLRFYGFKRSPSGVVTTLMLPGEPNSRVFPWKGDDSGNFIGFAYRDIDANNTYTYQWVIYLNGQYNFLDYTTGEDVFCTAFNATLATCLLSNTASVSGVLSVLYDFVNETFSLLPLPSGAFAVTPTGMNKAGSIVGSYTTKIGSGPFPTSRVDQVIMTPIAPPTLISRMMQRFPSLEKLLGARAWRGKGLNRTKISEASPLWKHLTKKEKGE